jgi:hypothetical protein
VRKIRILQAKFNLSENSSNKPVLNSGFAEGISSQDTEQDNSSSSCQRKVIVSGKSFELLHTVLYYLYTNAVCFCTDEDAEPPPGMPECCDPEQVYAIAHEFGLEDLQQKTISFLRDTCNIENIADRLFGDVSLVYEEAYQVYKEYALQNWNEIKDSKEWTEYFAELEVESQQKHVISRLLKFISRLDAKF